MFFTFCFGAALVYCRPIESFVLQLYWFYKGLSLSLLKNKLATLESTCCRPQKRRSIFVPQGPWSYVYGISENPFSYKTAATRHIQNRTNSVACISTYITGVRIVMDRWWSYSAHLSSITPEYNVVYTTSKNHSCLPIHSGVFDHCLVSSPK